MKQLSINKFLIGFLFVLGVVLIPTYNVDAYVLQLDIDPGEGGNVIVQGTIPVTNSYDINLTVNLDDESYNPNENMKVTAVASVDTCSNTTSGLVVTGNVINSGDLPKTILSEDVAGGSSINGVANFTAPSQPGDYSLEIKATSSKLGDFYLYDAWYGGKISASVTSFDDDGIHYEILTDSTGDGRIIGVNKLTDVGWGPIALSDFLKNGRLLVDSERHVSYKIEQSSAVVNSTTFEIPFTVAGIRVWSKPASGIENGPINENEKTTIFWKATGLSPEEDAYCKSPDYKDPDQKFGVEGSFETENLASSKTFSITCTDETGDVVVTPTVNPTTYYYKLVRCSDGMIYETGPFSPGTYSSGDIRVGYVESPDDTANYVVTGSSPNSYSDAQHNIQTTGSGLSGCPE